MVLKMVLKMIFEEEEWKKCNEDCGRREDVKRSLEDAKKILIPKVI